MMARAIWLGNEQLSLKQLELLAALCRGEQLAMFVYPHLARKSFLYRSGGLVSREVQTCTILSLFRRSLLVVDKKPGRHQEVWWFDLAPHLKEGGRHAHDLARLIRGLGSSG